MKIAISGTSDGFGKYASSMWSQNHEIVRIDLRDEINVILSQISPCDMFLNHAYSKDTKQSLVFSEIFEKWKDSEKTIINFGTSAVHEDGCFSPMYVSNKKHLINLSHTLNIANPYKKVRVINLYPNTLEHNKRVGSNKVNFSEVYDVIEFQLNLPQSLELTHVCISRTTTSKVKTLM